MFRLFSTKVTISSPPSGFNRCTLFFLCFIVQVELILYARYFATYVSKDLGNLMNKGKLVLLAYGEEEGKLVGIMRHELMWPTS